MNHQKTNLLEATCSSDPEELENANPKPLQFNGF
jgi:hypothetical protein